MVSQVAVAHHRADAQAAVGQLSILSSGSGLMSTSVAGVSTELHQIDQRRAAGDERRCCGSRTRSIASFSFVAL